MIPDTALFPGVTSIMDTSTLHLAGEVFAQQSLMGDMPVENRCTESRSEPLSTALLEMPEVDEAIGHGALH